jgi:FtsH-binding integral membrane protein
VQPAVVQTALGDHLFYRVAGLGWLVLAAVIVLFAAVAAFAKPVSALVGWTAAVLVVLSMTLMTIYRDGIRDLTLLSKGYDVWDRVVVTNWGVVGLFLLLFVAGLGVVGWLISVVMRAERVMESAV